MTFVDIHPRADVRVAAGAIRRAVQKQENQCPDSVRLITGDSCQCIPYTFTYCNFMQSIGKCLCLHTERIKCLFFIPAIGN